MKVAGGAVGGAAGGAAGLLLLYEGQVKKYDNQPWSVHPNTKN